MLKLPCTVLSLATKHNFQQQRVEYIVELSLLGQVISAEVNEEFVQRMDAAAGAQATAMQQQVPQQQLPMKRKVRQQKQAPRQEDYSIGYVDEKPYEDYTDEEISQL
jgi:hypothetical protein